MGMNISNGHLKPVAVTDKNLICPRCGHRVVYHITEGGGIMSQFAAKAKLIACFIIGCTGCAQYHGEV